MFRYIKEADHEKLHIVWFHLNKMFTKGKSKEKQFAKGWERGNQGGTANETGVFLGVMKVF